MAMSIYTDYLMFYPSRQHIKMESFQVQVYIQQWFHDEQGARFMQNLTFLMWSEMILGM